MRLCILRIARNDDLIKLMQLEVKVFLDEVDNLLDQLFRAQKGVEYDIVK
jgi:hypothetical protein